MGNHSSLKIQVVQYIGQGLTEFSVCKSEKKKKRTEWEVDRQTSPPPSDHAREGTWASPASSILTQPGKAGKYHFPSPTPFQRGRERADVVGADSYGT